MSCRQVPKFICLTNSHESCPYLKAHFCCHKYTVFRRCLATILTLHPPPPPPTPSPTSLSSSRFYARGCLQHVHASTLAEIDAASFKAEGSSLIAQSSFTKPRQRTDIVVVSASQAWIPVCFGAEQMQS